MIEIQFVVPGQPLGKPRHRSVALMRNGKPVIGKNGRPVMIQYSDKKGVDFEKRIALAARQAMQERPASRRPFFVNLDIRVQIPKSWSKVRREKAARDEIGATKKPDADNVEKAVLDAMNKIVWEDDGQVIKCLKNKRYAEIPGIVVIAYELPKESA